ncbi:MAG: protein kinase [Acetobacteraceae bacterium]|nr:protein kinase [Acetobacteraceae bacterium]
MPDYDPLTEPRELPPVPSTLGKYELRGPIGSGASGVVYHAWDPDLMRRVAIKRVQLLGRTDAEQQELRARFRREAQIAGRLGHSGVVSVYDYGEQAGAAYLVMEFVDGDSLAALLQDLRQRNETMTPERAVAIVQEMLLALAACHRAGVLHRDIKPGNVMLSRNGAVKLTDFGIARTETSDLTAQGALIGTPTYMSPEQFESRAPVDARSDLYACGVVLYELLTGRKPFEGDLFAVMHQVRTEQPVPPSRAGAAVPPALDAVVLRAMAKQPVDRFPNAEAFAAALTASLVPAPPTSNVRRIGLVLAGLTAVAALGGMAWHFLGAGRLGGDRSVASASPPAVGTDRPAASAASQPASPAAGRPAAPAVIQPAALAAGQPGAPLASQPATPAAAGQPSAPATGQAEKSPAAPTPEAWPPKLDARLVPALGQLPCAAITAAVQRDPPLVSLRGIVGDDTARTALAPLLAAYTGEVARDALQVFPAVGALCQAADLMRGAEPGALRLALADPRARLLAGEAIRVALRMPDFAGEVRLDYITDQGQTVVHLDPAAGDVHRWAAGERVALGPAGDGVIGSVGEPYGTDMVLVTVSVRTLLPGTRAGQEPADPYLHALHAAAVEAARRGERVAAGALVLETAAR